MFVIVDFDIVSTMYLVVYVYVCYRESWHRVNDELHLRSVSQAPPSRPAGQDSSKGGAVETGCSGLYDVIY